MEGDGSKEKMHTAEHILFRSLKTYIPNLELQKIKLGDEESSFFVFAPELNWELLFKAEELANSIVKEDRAVEERVISKKEADTQ